MEWTESLKQILKETAKTLKGASRRKFMAQIVLELGYGGQSKAEKELISQYNYQEQELPTAETIRQKLNQLGYHPQRIAKTQPQKKFLRPMTSLNNYLSSIN